jgi:hypothetical protein
MHGVCVSVYCVVCLCECVLRVTCDFDVDESMSICSYKTSSFETATQQRDETLGVYSM